MELTLRDVQASLAKLCSHYPEAGHNGDSLRQISADYFEDLTDDRTSSEEFAEVVKLARRRCKFFPKIADIIELRNELRANPTRKPVAGLIEEESMVKTPEMMEAGRLNCKIVQVMLDLGISDTEAREIVLSGKMEINEKPTLRVVGGRG